PDNSGRPRGLTEAEFIEVMRTGVDLSCQRSRQGNPPLYGLENQPDGVCDLGPRGLDGYDPNKLQVMPWVAFHNMTDIHLSAIYAYLSALPQATACNTPPDGCPGFNGAAIASAPGRYAYASTDECPNPAPPQ